MLAEVGGVPEAPAALLGIAALFAVLGYVVLIGLAQVWKHTLGAGFVWIADLIDSISFRIPVIHKRLGLGPLAAVFRAADRQVYGWITHAAASSWHGATWCFNQSYHLLKAGFAEIEALGRWTLNHSRWLKYVFAEYLIYRATRRALGEVNSLLRHRHYTPAQVSKANAHAAARANAHATHATSAAGHALDWSEARWRGLTKRTARLERWRAHLRWLAAFGSVAAVVAYGIGKLGLRWLRCSNVKNVGRNLCKMDVQLLESLLADTALIVGGFSVVEFATYIIEALAFVETKIIGFVHELGDPLQDYLGPGEAEAVGLAKYLEGGFGDYLGPL